LQDLLQAGQTKWAEEASNTTIPLYLNKLDDVELSSLWRVEKLTSVPQRNAPNTIFFATSTDHLEFIAPRPALVARR
jgi:hypothetical protein